MPLFPKIEIPVRIVCVGDDETIWFASLQPGRLHTRDILSIINVEDAVFAHNRRKHDKPFEILILAKNILSERERKLGWARCLGNSWEPGIRTYPSGRYKKSKQIT